jgi:hypothetical protein
MAAIWRQINTNCEQVLNSCSSGSRGKYTIGNTTLNAISSIVLQNLEALEFVGSKTWKDLTNFEALLYWRNLLKPKLMLSKVSYSTF